MPAGDSQQKVFVLEEVKPQNNLGSRDQEIDLFGLFTSLLRRGRYIVLATLVGMVLTGVYTFFLVTPMYEATAQLYVVNSKDSVLNLSDLQIGSYLASDYQLVFRTWEVNEQVIQNLKLPYSYAEMKGMLTITNPGNTRALFITVQSSKAEEAAAIANEYAAVARRYISETMATDTPSVLSTALVPTRPSSPNMTINMMLGALAGLFFSLVALTVQYLKNDRIITAEDIMQYTGASPLAVVPVMNPREGVVRPVTRRDPRQREVKK